MQELLLIVVFSGLGYFTLRPRVFDWFAVAYASASVYFLPGLVGSTHIDGDHQDLCRGAYVVMMCTLLAILFGGILVDRWRPSRQPGRPVRCRYLAEGLCLVALVGCGAAIYWSGANLLLDNKLEMFQTFTHWHILWSIGGLVGFVVAFAEGRRLPCTICALCLLFMAYTGTRYQLAIAVIAAITLSLAQRGRRALIANWRTCWIVLGFALAVFAYKQVYVYVKRGDFNAVVEQVRRDGFLGDAILHSEPFTTQHILNVTIIDGIHVGVQHLRDVLMEAFAINGGTAGVSYGDHFRRSMLHQRKAGIASSILAEMISTGGWPLLGLFLGVFCGLLYWGSTYARPGEPHPYRGVFAAWMALWAFYIHRNDLSRILSFAKQFLFVVLLATAAALVIEIVSTRLATSALAKGSSSMATAGRPASQRSVARSRGRRMV